MGEVCQGCEGPLAGSIGSFASGSRCLVVRRGVLGGLCWRSGGCRRGWRRRGWWPCVPRRPVSEGGFLDCRPVPLARWSWIWWGGCASRATPVARRRRSHAPRRGSVRGWPSHGWASSATPTHPHVVSHDVAQQSTRSNGSSPTSPPTCSNAPTTDPSKPSKATSATGSKPGTTTRAPSSGPSQPNRSSTRAAQRGAR